MRRAVRIAQAVAISGDCQWREGRTVDTQSEDKPPVLPAPGRTHELECRLIEELQPVLLRFSGHCSNLYSIAPDSLNSARVWAITSRSRSRELSAPGW